MDRLIAILGYIGVFFAAATFYYYVSSDPEATALTAFFIPSILLALTSTITNYSILMLLAFFITAPYLGMLFVSSYITLGMVPLSFLILTIAIFLNNRARLKR